MKENKGTVLLSFDVEEFDMPLEYGQQVPVTQQMQTGYDGFKVMMQILDSMDVPATLFTTANFADHFESDIRGIDSRHELASHTYYHSDFNKEDLLRSKQRLEAISGKQIKGLRMPRMRAVDMNDVKNAGYVYDSSVNPTWIPGRYNHLNLPRRIYHEEQMLRLPASVSPLLRIPLFWLAFKNFPYSFFLLLVKQTIAKDGYACLYFHPWEFVDLSAYRVPGYTKRLAGKPLQDKLSRLIIDLKKEYVFSTIEHYLQSKQLVS
jgi:peptidoglycan/xylan/chitin deacetylase (PgdA/CDA1 family)